MESKKSRIIKMIEESPVMPNGSKIIHGGTIVSYGFYSSYDCGDISYIMRVANSMGYKCRAGLCLHLYPREKK